MTGIFCSFHPKCNMSPLTLKQISTLLKHRGSADTRYVYVDNLYKCNFKGHPLDHEVLLVSVVYTPVSGTNNSFFSVKNEGEWFWAVVDGSIYNSCLSKQDSGSAKKLIDGYLKHGTSMLKGLDGTFSFILYDGKKRLLFVGRDKLGTKPFYYVKNHNRIVFSSEIKAFIALNWFKPRMNIKNISRFIKYGQDYFEGETFFKGVLEMPSSYYLALNLETHERQFFSYWNPLQATNINYEKDSTVLACRFIELLKQSISQSLNNQEKISIPLSGGLDSTLLAYILEMVYKSRKIDKIDNIFSISIVYPELKGEFPDESFLIKKFLRRSEIKHNLLIVPSTNHFKTHFRKILWHFEQPLTDPSLFCLWEIARHANNEGIRILYSGVFADGLLGGIPEAYVAELLLTRPMKGLRKWIDFKRTENIRLRRIISYLFAFSCSVFARSRLSVSKGISSYDKLWKITEYKNAAERLFRYLDRASMAFGIDAKTPYASNSKLVEFLTYLPVDFKLNKGWIKFIQREAMSILEDFPKEIIWNPQKNPFGNPTKKWVYEDFYDFFVEILSDARFLTKLIDVPMLIDRFKRKELDPHLVWRIVNVELWCRVFFEK